MDYILLALSAWVIFGVVVLIEKFLLQKASMENPDVLAFYTGIFSIFSVLIFLPFAHFTSVGHLIYDLSCGFLFFFGQLCLYRAMKQGGVSEVVPITGALIPIFSVLILNYVFKQYFYRNEIIAIVLLILGTILLAFKKTSFRKLILYAIASSLLFASYYSMVKFAYTPFKSNFAFVRLGSTLAATLLFLEPEIRESVFATKHHSNKRKTSALFVSKEFLAGAGFLILNYAISIGNPAVVNALEGFQYVLIFFGALVLAKKFPLAFNDVYNREEIVQKFIGMGLIFGGLIFLNF
ncbi:MAG: hypothetical protein NVSMB66_0070 [Candidatus Doudnabacteria bacterium]